MSLHKYSLDNDVSLNPISYRLTDTWAATINMALSRVRCLCRRNLCWDKVWVSPSDVLSAAELASAAAFFCSRSLTSAENFAETLAISAFRVRILSATSACSLCHSDMSGAQVRRAERKPLLRTLPGTRKQLISSQSHHLTLDCSAPSASWLHPPCWMDKRVRFRTLQH